MNISKELDLAIKTSEAKKTAGGYLVGGKEFATYMTNAEWAAYMDNMLPSAIAEFGDGGGGELLEKSGRPPKMASYGSSSRMIYKLSCHKENFHYEKKLPTTVGGTANLDGFCECAHRYIFVEAKCHEPYSSKSKSVSKCYEKLYCFINKHMAGNVEINMKPSSCGKYIEVEYISDGEKLERFDLKQMICHLLGIATGLLQGTLEQKQIDFIYLLFDPTGLILPTEVQNEIRHIYDRTCYECNLINFAALFEVIFAFLKKEKYGNSISDEEVKEIVQSFTFSLASQELYPMLLESI